MALSAFTDKTVVPGEAGVQQVLGPARDLWAAIVDHAGSLGMVAPEWKHYGKQAGWGCKLMIGKRNLCFLYPGVASLTVVVVLGENAWREAMALNLPEEVRAAALEARAYAEGRSLVMPLAAGEQTDWLLALLDCKWRA